jgi:sulfate permease, SulP family
MKPLSQVRHDIVGGLVSATIAIPLAMGYGMFAFSSLGENYFADGALAGLATASVLPVICVLLGDKTTTVYAPRVISTFFIGLLIFGLVRSDAPAINAGGIPFILGITFLVLLLAGALEALFGLIKLGTLIKFAPQPVMAGFQNAAAALLFLVQLGNVCGFDYTSHSHRCIGISLRSSRSVLLSRQSLLQQCGKQESFCRKFHRSLLPSPWAGHSILSAISSVSPTMSARSSPVCLGPQWA